MYTRKNLVPKHLTYNSQHIHVAFSNNSEQSKKECLPKYSLLVYSNRTNIDIKLGLSRESDKDHENVDVYRVFIENPVIFPNHRETPSITQVSISLTLKPCPWP